ncbi:MAG: sensor histidine kinase [Saprospiraceae bacterium]
MMNVLNKYPFFSHVLFWIGVFLLDGISGDVFTKLYSNCVFGISNIIPQMVGSYFTVYYLVPKFLSKKKYLKFILGFIISAYFVSILARVLVVHVAEPIVRVPPFSQESFWEIATDIKWLFFRYFPATYIMVFFFWLVTYLNFSRKNIALQQEKTSAELKMLKSQLNPHFLFNTLNNIYSLSLDNSPKTSESIGKLSEILDYVLYRCESKLVPLSGEVSLLENYIDLEKLRYDDRLKITFEKRVDSAIEIAPLILLSLVENAFKHGAGEDGGSPEIKILLESTSRVFIFSVKNSVVDSETKKTSSAIGLKNIQKQLILIYGKNYDLEIKEKANLFSVTLKLHV